MEGSTEEKKYEENDSESEEESMDDRHCQEHIYMH